MNIDQAPDVMKVPDVASILDCSDKMVYSLIGSGALESISLGSSYRITKRAVCDFLNIEPVSDVPEFEPGLRVIEGGP